MGMPEIPVDEMSRVVGTVISADADKFEFFASTQTGAHKIDIA